MNDSGKKMPRRIGAYRGLDTTSLISDVVWDSLTSPIRAIVDEQLARHRAAMLPAGLVQGVPGTADSAGLTRDLFGGASADPFGVRACAAKTLDPLRISIRNVVGLDRMFALRLPESIILRGTPLAFPDWLGNVFGSLEVSPIARSLLAQAQRLAGVLFPPNLQDFDDQEWEHLINICTEDGIGMMWAPSSELLRALLQEPDRSGRYSYLLDHRPEVLRQLDEGLSNVTHGDLDDLTGLARVAVQCARQGAWEGALSLAGNVLNSAMEHHGIEWYRQEFSAQIRDLRGHAGPGATLRRVDTAIPLPERSVGIFDLRAHLVLRSLKNVFADTKNGVTTQDTFNRHLAAHRASYDSYREEFTLPALLAMHTLLRVLNEAKEEAGSGR